MKEVSIYLLINNMHLATLQITVYSAVIWNNYIFFFLSITVTVK